MRPYYSEKRIEIFLGDSREILRLFEKMPCIITDPPYGNGDLWDGGGKHTDSAWNKFAGDAKTWDMEICNGISETLARVPEAIVWGGQFYSLPPSRCWLVWDKRQPDNWTSGQCELAWTNLDYPIRCFRMAQCEFANEREEKLHPTQKPLGLMKWCLKWVKSDIILDPFMGSGTTLRAAKDLGRRAIGIEIEEKYCEIAAKRLSQEVLEFKP